MPLNYQNLDARTRQYMIEEIDRDIAAGTIYISSYLTAQGQQDWPQMMRAAAQSGTDATLAVEITRNGRLAQTTQRRKPSGDGMYTAAIPVNASEVMSEGEFNRYYARSLCRRAIDDGIPSLEVYRAKQVANPRPASQEKIGTKVDATALLSDLRTTIGVEPALGMPPGPGSGLTVKLP